MKYHKHILKKIKDDKWIINAWTLDNAKEFVDSFDGTDYHWNVLA